jgi:hypothetical protein
MAQLLPTTHPLPFRSDEGIEYTVQLTPNEGVYINPKKIDLTSFSAKNPSVIEVVADETGMTRERLKNVLALMRRES